MKGSERHHDTNTVSFKDILFCLDLLRNIINRFRASNGQLCNARNMKLIANNRAEAVEAEF